MLSGGMRWDIGFLTFNQGVAGSRPAQPTTKLGNKLTRVDRNEWFFCETLGTASYPSHDISQL